MQDDFSDSRPSRRAFLRAAGLVGTAAVAGRLLTTVERTRAAGIGDAKGYTAGSVVHVGLLLPASTVYPGLAEQFAAGMQLANTAQPSSSAMVRPLQLVTQMIGPGYGTAYRQAQSLLEAKVDVVVGLLTPMLASRVADLFQANQTVLLASSTGENLVSSASNAVVFHHSLQQWQANWALGNWAAQAVGRRAVIAGDFHSSGYDSLFGFQQGFAAAGGTVLETIVTHGPQPTHTVDYLLARVQSLRPDLLFAAYCGANAAELVRAYAKLGAARPPLLGNGFLTDEQLLPALGNAALGISSAHAWSATLDTPANRTFIAAYQAKYQQSPTSIALLGYETATLLNTALATSGGATRPAQLGPALASATFASPRGTVTMDGSSRASTGPLYLREVQLVNGAPVNVVHTQLQAAPPNAGAAQGGGPKTGWLEAYLSI